MQSGPLGSLLLQQMGTDTGWTHAKLWGDAAMRHWRGRYETKTARLSVMPPAGISIFEAPDELIHKLGKQMSVLEYWFFPSPV